MSPSSNTRRLIHVAILLGLAFYFGRLVFNGDLANYVNTRIAWLVILAAIILTAYGFASFAHPQEPSCDCEHQHSSWKGFALLLPLLLGLGLPSRPLGAGSIDGDIQMMLRENVDMSMLATPERIDNPAMLYNPMNDLYPERQFSTDDPSAFTILDWLRLYADTDDKDAFEGQKADVVGFVVRDPTDADRFVVTRFFMRHCMFDTIPVGIAVQWDGAEDLREDTWVRVRGKFQLDVLDGSQIPVLAAQSVKEVQQPEVPYMYPQAY
jgi:putative membrane protein